MSYYYKYSFISPESVYATVKEELSEALAQERTRVHLALEEALRETEAIKRKCQEHTALIASLQSSNITLKARAEAAEGEVGVLSTKVASALARLSEEESARLRAEKEAERWAELRKLQDTDAVLLQQKQVEQQKEQELELQRRRETEAAAEAELQKRQEAERATQEGLVEPLTGKTPRNLEEEVQGNGDAAAAAPAAQAKEEAASEPAAKEEAASEPAATSPVEPSQKISDVPPSGAVDSPSVATLLLYSPAPPPASPASSSGTVADIHTLHKRAILSFYSKHKPEFANEAKVNDLWGKLNVKLWPALVEKYSLSLVAEEIFAQNAPLPNENHPELGTVFAPLRAAIAELKMGTI